MKPLERISATDYVVNNLIEYIASGKVKIGNKLLSEKEICNQFSVGRSTAREALRVLQAMGYVNIILGRGAFVTRTSVKSSESKQWFVENRHLFDDIMLVRSRLEVLAAELAAERATDEDLSAIENAYQSFVAASNTKNNAKMTISDELFHKLIFIASHNDFLIDLIEHMNSIYLSIRAKTFSMDEIRDNANVPHANILHALKARDKAMAAAAMEAHMAISSADLHSFGFEENNAPSKPNP